MADMDTVGHALGQNHCSSQGDKGQRGDSSSGPGPVRLSSWRKVCVCVCVCVRVYVCVRLSACMHVCVLSAAAGA
jgi:hypothetical protein